ncbi:hypothetical protein BC831DRAFT_459789 [Entophlyctis helioformis]|nr:hypothetical protein BC831DRAFT_459789 [Entophlyctis helioformis]
MLAKLLLLALQASAVFAVSDSLADFLASDDFFAKAPAAGSAPGAAAANAAAADAAAEAADPVSLVQRFDVFYSLSNANTGKPTAAPVARGTILVDALSPKRNANRLEAPLAVPKELLAVDAARSTRYHVDVHVGEGDSKRILSASVPLCMLQSAKFQEMLTLHLDIHGNPFHLDYLVAAHSCDESVNLSKVSAYKTFVTLGRVQDAPRPTMEQAADEVEGAKNAPEQSFLQKYWYYLIPMAIMFAMGTSGGGEEAKKGAPAAPAS